MASTKVVGTPAARNAVTKRLDCAIGMSSSVEFATKNGGSSELTAKIGEAVRAAGVPTTFVEATGRLHSIAMLNPELKAKIVEFYRETLGSGSGSADGAG